MKNIFKKASALLLALTVLTLTGCGGEESGKDGRTIVKVGVTGEYNDQWDTINELLAEENIEVELVKFSDYTAPNRALADGEIDLNAFQHKAFFKNDVKQKKYDLADIGDTIIAPLSVYNNKDKISSIDDIKDGDTVAIPSDLTNGGRALKLLEAAGLIVCDPAKGYVPTKADITEYKVNIEIMEAESSALANILPDCAAAVINGGNALTAGLKPSEDAIFTEDIDAESSDYVSELINIIAARTEDKDNEIYKKIVDTYHTEEVRQTVLDSYGNAFICAW